MHCLLCTHFLLDFCMYCLPSTCLKGHCHEVIYSWFLISISLFWSY
jgi:hypothetical protein